MASSNKGSVRIEGLEKVVKRLKNADAIYSEPWREMMGHLGESGHEKAQARAPKLTGELAAGVTHRMDARPVPLWVVISDKAESDRGFRYPFALNAGHAKRAGGREYKFRYAGTGRSTRRWFSGVLTLLRKEARVEINMVARAIERMWDR